MSRTLVIAEKPSVGRDIARVLPGPFKKQEGYLEGPDHTITWAVGHLVQLAEPEEYGDQFKKWRMADLPIVPPAFKLVVRDERSKKQMSVVTKLLKDFEMMQQMMKQVMSFGEKMPKHMKKAMAKGQMPPGLGGPGGMPGPGKKK